MPIIKNLVVAGGAHIGFSYFGALKTLCDRKFFSISSIESIYATSVGALVAVFISLDCDWSTIESYIVNRPWKKLFPFTIRNSLMAVPKGGLFDISTIEKIIEPVLLDHNLSLDTNLDDFYQYNKKEMHFISTSYEPLKLVDISYKTHPTWRLVDAIYASSCLPVLFVPYNREDNDIYIDGAMFANYPIHQCFQDGKKPEETLGVSFEHKQPDNVVHKRTPFVLIFFLLDLLTKMWKLVKEDDSVETQRAPYQVKIVGDTRFEEALEVISSEKKRKYMIDKGVDAATSFLDSLKEQNDEYFSK